MVFPQIAGAMPIYFTRRLVAPNSQNPSYSLQTPSPSEPTSTQGLSAQSVAADDSAAYAPTDLSSSENGGLTFIVGSALGLNDGYQGGGSVDNTTSVSTAPSQGGVGCGSQIVKTWAKRSGAVAAWFSNTSGVTAGFHYAKGASSSISTGFTSNASFHVTYQANHKLCGVHDYPGGKPYIIAAKS
jgi:hypothetical protein